MPGVFIAAEQVLERLDERQAHVLLLERQPDLGGEGLLDLRRGKAQRLREAEPRLERHDEEVDQVGQGALDLLAPLPGSRVDDHRRQHPTEHGHAIVPTMTSQARHSARDAASQRHDGAADGARNCDAEQPLGRRLVYIPAAMSRDR